MATINEIIAKRNELQATNPNATNVDARKALTPAPVTGVPPTTPGSFNAKTQGMNVAERQAVRAGMTTPTTPTAPQVTGVDGQKFTQAPVDPTTGLSKPIAPTVQPTPTVPKTDSTPGITQADLQKAQAESEKIKAQNEGQINLNKQQSDLKEQERQRAITEQNNALANNEWAILNTLKIGGVIPESVKTSPYYKSAQSTYNNLQKFSSYSTTDLVTAMNQGAILPGTQVYNEMMKDPAMKTKLSEAQAYRSTKPVNIPQIEEVASSEILANNPVTAGMLDDGVITIDEYNNATNTPEVIAQAKVKEEKINKYNTLKAEYDAIEDEVDAQFPASPFAAAIKADRQKAKYKNLILAQGEMDSAIGALNDIKATSSALFEANLQTQQSNIAFQRQKEMANYNANLDLQKNQAEYDQKINQNAQALRDPNLAIPAMIEEYKKLGIPFTRSTQQIIQDFEGSGKDLATYLSELQGTIQSKPEYRAMADAQMRSYAPPVESTQYSFANIGDGRIAIQNPKTGQVEFASAGSVSSANTPTSSSARYLDIPTGTDVGVQCGQFARTLCGMDATPGGNSLDARKKAYTDTAPVAGGMVLFTGSGYDKTYGHIAVIESVNQDGTMNIVESNLKNDNRVTRRTIQANDSAISGFYNDTPLAKQGTGTQASSDAQNWFNLIQKGTTSYEDVMKKLGGTKVGQAVLQEINGLISSKGGAIPALPDSPQVKQMDTLLDTVKGLVEDPSAIENLSGFFQTSPWDAMSGKNDDTRSAIEFLVKGQTLQQLIDAKAQGATFGALSNEELRMLQNSASRLTAMIEFDENDKVKNFKGKESTVKAELKKLLNLFKEKREKMVNPGMNQSTQQNMTPEVEEEINAFDAWQANQ